MNGASELTMRNIFAAIVLMVGVAWAPSASHALTLQIQSGRIAESILIPLGPGDILGGIAGPGFSAMGIGPAQQIQAGGVIPSAVADGLDIVDFQPGSPISVAGFGSCSASFPGCGVSLRLTNPGFTLPPFFTDFTITVPFTAAGRLSLPGAQFDLVGSGFLTYTQRTFVFAGENLGVDEDAVYSFVVPELSTGPLAVVGVALTFAASWIRRRLRCH